MKTRIRTRVAALPIILTAVVGLYAGCALERPSAPSVDPWDPPKDTSLPPDQSAAGSAPADGSATCLAPGAADAVPDLLSETGCYVNGAPSPTLVPFEVNAPLWTDGASKTRFLSVPPDAGIRVGPDGDFELPPGSVAVKTLSLDGHKLETRLFMRHLDGSYTGVAYAWDAAQSEAYRVPDGDVLPEVGSDRKGWEIPSEGQCLSCHTAPSHMTLGLELAQLDRVAPDPDTGEPVDQLARLSQAGLFAEGAGPEVATGVAPLVDYRDVQQPLEARARAYLHANCSSCHLEAQGYCTGDMRFGVPLPDVGVCDEPPKQRLPEWAGAAVSLVTPGAPEASALLLRMAAEPGGQAAMPPLGRRRVHDDGVALVKAWIESLSDCSQ